MFAARADTSSWSYYRVFFGRNPEYQSIGEAPKYEPKHEECRNSQN